MAMRPISMLLLANNTLTFHNNKKEAAIGSLFFIALVCIVRLF